MEVPDRFWANVMPEPNSGCWLWVGDLGGSGRSYGRITVDGRRYYAHRLSYEAHVGTIPPDQEIDHLCRVRCCVNPAHLEAVPHAENVRRGENGKAQAEIQKAKTHCPHGHPYSEDNVRINSRGARECRACNRERCHSYYHSRKAA